VNVRNGWKADTRYATFPPVYFLMLAVATSFVGPVDAVEPVADGYGLYLACGLEPTDNQFSECVSTALYVVMDFGHRGEGGNTTGGDVKFCLPRSSIVSVENVRPLIDAYRTQYERDPRAFAAVTPTAAFLRAMRREWPCAGGR